MELHGKTVLITGGAVRVGARIAFAFARRGARVLIHALRHREEARLLAESLPGTGHAVLPAADLALPDAGKELFFAALAAAGNVDVLVSNASCYRLTTPDAAERYRAVNFAAPLELAAAFAAQKRPGAVIFVLDQVVLQKDPPQDNYTVSRVRLKEAVPGLALEFAPLGIRVNAVAPGPMIPPEGLEGSKMEKTLRSVPLRRRVEPDDLASAVCFLAENDSVTGAVLPVDCGQHLGK